METSLHRQLKQHYCEDPSQHEVPLGKFRIDAVAGDQLIEIQHGSLAAIRDKIKSLLQTRQVKVVKPIIQRKKIIRQDKKGGRVIGRRLSPKRCSLLNLFDDLVYFVRVFPHANLEIEAILVEVEEWRYPGHGKRRRRRARDFQIEDQRLVQVNERALFRSPGDLLKLIPAQLPDSFHTGHLAEQMSIPRWNAQRIAYCLRETGAVQQAGKQGNAILYRLANSGKRRPSRSSKRRRGQEDAA